ncbi:hypothetical protein NDN08_000008 [Rhodosorus marinus]|uniref:C2 domain-containing protein n=1 Tax=Rhodosorus marinus TaxID=101924 RepID=A0AAV8UHB9_9RHOD|nr:hypothetical protein NDN08_000008 [Rhodosorus marinus]
MGHSDVYVSVLAIAHDGTTANGQTATIFDTGNPVWEGRNPSYFPHILDFGVGQWDKIVVQAWDRDSGKTSQQLTKATAKDLQNPLNEKYGRQTSLFCDVPRACRTNPYVEVKVGYYPEVYVEN